MSEVSEQLSTELLADLATIDTPTVCNALESVAPDRRGFGYTVEPLVCTRPELGVMVGYARTATIRAQHPADRRNRPGDYYEYIDNGGPKPAISIIQDLDGDSRGYGSFWGEVNSNIHKGLGCLGVITDGSVRDLPDVADGFQMMADRIGPSHAFVHVVSFGGVVSVAGMTVAGGDLIHADQHGAVVIPFDVADQVMDAAAAIARREGVIIKAAQQPGFNIDRLREAQGNAAEIH